MSEKLTPDLIGLIHHVELNKAGWWDKGIHHLILGTLWLSGEPATLDALRLTLVDSFAVELDPLRLQQQINTLRGQGKITQLNDGRYKMSESARKKFVADFTEAEHVQDRAKRKFLALLLPIGSTVAPDDVWDDFQSSILIPLIRSMGARTYQLLSGQSSDIGAQFDLHQFLERYQPAHRELLRDAVIAFLDPKDDEVRDYVLRVLNAYFIMQAGSLSEGDVQRMSDLTNRPVTFRVLVDTNFLFSILGLDENPSNEAAEALRNVARDIGDPVTLRLVVSDATVKETQSVLSAARFHLAGVRFTANMADAVAESGLMGFARRIAQEAQRSGQSIDPDEYFGLYISNLVEILKGRGVQMLDDSLDSYSMDRDVLDDLNNQMEYEKRFYKGREKRYETMLHDVMLWHYVDRQRPPSLDSPLDATCWIVTVDFRFMRFDAHKNRAKQNAIPICLHPASLMQVLQFWVPRTPEFEEAVIGNLRWPFLLQEFGSEAEEVSLRILRTLSMFENMADLPKSTIVSILMNSALRNRIASEQKVQEQVELVREVLIEENQVAAKDLAEANARVSQLEHHSSQAAQSLEQLKRDVQRRDVSAEELIAKLASRNKDLRANQKRIAALESAAESRLRSGVRLKWVFLHALLPLLILAGVATLVSLLLLSQINLKVYQVVPVAAVASIFVSFVWADRTGTSVSEIATWWPHQWINKTRNVIGAIVFALAVAVLAAAIYDDISS